MDEKKKKQFRFVSFVHHIIIMSNGITRADGITPIYHVENGLLEYHFPVYHVSIFFPSNSSSKIPKYWMYLYQVIENADIIESKDRFLSDKAFDIKNNFYIYLKYKFGSINYVQSVMWYNLIPGYKWKIQNFNVISNGIVKTHGNIEKPF